MGENQASRFESVVFDCCGPALARFNLRSPQHIDWASMHWQLCPCHYTPISQNPSVQPITFIQNEQGWPWWKDIIGGRWGRLTDRHRDWRPWIPDNMIHTGTHISRSSASNLPHVMPQNSLKSTRKLIHSGHVPFTQSNDVSCFPNTHSPFRLQIGIQT